MLTPGLSIAKNSHSKLLRRDLCLVKSVFCSTKALKGASLSCDSHQHAPLFFCLSAMSKLSVLVNQPAPDIPHSLCWVMLTRGFSLCYCKGTAPLSQKPWDTPSQITLGCRIFLEEINYLGHKAERFLASCNVCTWGTSCPAEVGAVPTSSQCGWYHIS